MNFFIEAIQWIFAPERRGGIANDVAQRLGEHVFISVVSLIAAAVISIPIGYAIGHTGKGREVAVALSGAARALPSLGLLTIVTLAVGIANSQLAAVVVLLLLGIPSVLAGAYAGLESIDRRTIDAARAVGMTEWQILIRVEIPLGLPLLLGGLRSAALQIIATATLASYVGLGGLGIYIFAGLNSRDLPQLLGGAILVTILALAVDAIFAIAQRFAVPRGVTAGKAKEVRTGSSRSRAAVGTPAQ